MKLFYWYLSSISCRRLFIQNDKQISWRFFFSNFFICVKFIFIVSIHSNLFLYVNMFYSIWFFLNLRLMFFLCWNKFTFFELNSSSFFIMCRIQKSTNVKYWFRCKSDLFVINVIDSNQNICNNKKKTKKNYIDNKWQLFKYFCYDNFKIEFIACDFLRFL